MKTTYHSIIGTILFLIHSHLLLVDTCTIIYVFDYLNIFQFLCSIFVLNSVVIPALCWILPDQCSQLVSHKLCALAATLKFYSFLRLALIQLFYVSTIFKACIDLKNRFVACYSSFLSKWFLLFQSNFFQLIF
jgi:hypothetical protein